MENKLNDLFIKLNENIKNETQTFKFFCNRLISEFVSLFNCYQIDYTDYNIDELLKENIYDGCKRKQNEYIYNVNLIHNSLSEFITEAEKNGTNSLECEDEAKKYHEKIKQINDKVIYEEEFTNFKNNIFNVMGLSNQQLNSEIIGILNKNKIELETTIIKLRQENNQVFNEVREEIKRYSMNHNTKPVNPKTRIEIIKSNLIGINNSKINEIEQKCERVFGYASDELSPKLIQLLKTKDNQKTFSNLLFNIFIKQFKINFSVFLDKINNVFIDYMIDRTMKQIAVNPKFEISRDKSTFDYSKDFLNQFNLIDLDLAFANIELLLSTNYNINATNPKYMKILNTINTVKAKTENLLKDIENEIMLSNIIEMQSQILRMHL